MDFFEVIISFITKKEVYGLVLIVLAGYIFYHFVKALTEKIINSGKSALERKRRKTIVELFQNIFKYIIFVIVVLFILELYGVDTKSLIAGLGILGAVVGLAMQDTMKDFISGITIMLENYYIVGDYVTYNNFTGEVISFGLKSTRIKNLNGEVLILANRNVTEIINISQKSADVIIDIPVAYEAKVEKVEKAIEEILEEIKKLDKVYKNEVTYLGINKLDNSSVNYRIKISCDQDSQWSIKRASLRIIKMILDKRNIKIPYPQVEVHNAKTNKN